MATLAKTPRSTMITLASTSSGPFILTFRLFDTDAIRVYRNGEVETGYTLDATFDDGYTDSASIMLDVAGEPGDVIIIDSDLNPHRAQDYLRGDPNLVDKLNIELARIWAAIRDTRQKADRSLRSFQDEEPVSGDAGQVLMIGDDGFEAGPTADEVSAAQGYAESAAESAATAALLAEALETAAYGESIPFAVFAAPQTIALPTGTIVDSVYISGLAQQRGASWTQTGNILTINEPGAIGMYGWYRYRIMEGEFAGQSNTFNGRPAAVAAANGAAWPVGSVISDGKVQYRYAGSPVVGIPDMPGWVPFGTAIPLHFGATPGASGDDRPAFVAAKAFVDASGSPLNVPAGEYRFSSALDFGNTPLLLEQGASIVNASGASAALVYRNGQYVTPRVYDGTNSTYAVGRTERGGRTHYVNGLNGTGTVAGPTIEDHTAWYDGSIDNAYSVMQQVDFNYIQYGERKKYLGQRASGTVSLYGGAINVFSVERKSGGSGRSEITPIACGLNFMPDANVAPHYNLYNDYIVSGHANADPYYREGFLAGASYLVQKYTQGNWLDADHDGSYGITIATRPQSGGFAGAPHTARSWPLRAGLVVAGYSGEQSITAGDAVGADNGFDRGVLIGSGSASEGGGSVWLPHDKRSRIGTGLHVTDTVDAGLLIEKIYSGYGIRVKNGGARFEDAYFALTGLPTSASGLASGQLWRDAAAGNVIKIVP